MACSSSTVRRSTGSSDTACSEGISAPLSESASVYRLLNPAQEEGLGVDWDEETRMQILSLLSSRIGRIAAPLPGQKDAPGSGAAAECRSGAGSERGGSGIHLLYVRPRKPRAGCAAGFPSHPRHRMHNSAARMQYPMGGSCERSDRPATLRAPPRAVAAGSVTGAQDA